jgi:propanol-preferring alcohol dehydrogenase
MAPELMHAWQVTRPGAIAKSPLKRRQLAVPTPAPGEVLVRLSACGVCRTDLHVVMGDLPTHRSPVTPGHEVVAPHQDGNKPSDRGRRLRRATGRKERAST